MPGLENYRLLAGIKGIGRGECAAMWIYKSREAWEALWGPVDDPTPAKEYPPRWRVWEQDYLGPLLATNPDDIKFTTYEELAASRETGASQ